MRSLILMIMSSCAWVISATTAASTPAQFDGLLEQLVAADKPGVSVVISRDGQVIYQAARGLSDVSTGKTIGVDDIFLMGSITKQYAAAAVLKLAAEGKVDLTASVASYLDDQRFADVTVQQLLNHTSGVASFTGIPGYWMDERIQKDLTTKQLIDVFADLPRDFPAGSAWAYNNSGYVLAGAVIEAVTDMSWHAYIQKALLAPLELTVTGYYDDASVQPNVIQGYTGGEQPQPALKISITQPHAAGALAATALEIDRWQYALHTGKVLSADWYAQMVTPTNVMPSYGYGLGLGSFLGETVREHSGGIHGFVTNAVWFDESQLSVVVLVNSDTPQLSPNMLSLRLAAIAMGKTLPADLPAQPISVEAMQRLHGSYQIDADTQRYLIYRDGELFSQRQGGGEAKVIFVGNDTFALHDSLAYFTVAYNDDGSVKGVDFYQAGSDSGDFANKVSNDVSVRPLIELTEQQAMRLVGEYELQPGFIITVRYGDEGLTAQATGQGAFALSAASANEVYNTQFGITLLFDAADQVPAQLTLLQGGARMPAPRVNH